jgi:hypothetical protein
MQKVAGNAVEQEEVMAAQEKGTGNGEAATSKSGKLDLAEKPEAAKSSEESGLALHQRTEATTGALQISGIRPIGASQLEVYGTILNNRPVSASHLRVLDYSIPGHRPVFATDLVIREDLTLPGGRPIMSSDPRLMASSLLPGGRPIAPNEIGDGEALMGYLD